MDFAVWSSVRLDALYGTYAQWRHGCKPAAADLRFYFVAEKRLSKEFDETTG